MALQNFPLDMYISNFCSNNQIVLLYLCSYVHGQCLLQETESFLTSSHYFDEGFLKQKGHRVAFSPNTN